MMDDFATAEDDPTASTPGARAADEATRLRDLTPSQWRSGIAAWLGWMFDGLDMHLYTVVALPFVAELLPADTDKSTVGYRGSLIQAAFLLGWAVGGGFFGRLGDRMGRARALMLTILTYALFTGLSSIAQAGGICSSFVSWRPWELAASGPWARPCSAKPGPAAGGHGSQRCCKRPSTWASSWPWPPSGPSPRWASADAPSSSSAFCRH